jgi:acyl-CoA-dependent ceramide synthase
MPKARIHTTKFFSLSYYNPTTGQYGVGKDDVYFIMFCIVMLTGLRATAMEYLLSPFARAWGVQKKKIATRFSEQGWLAIYCSIFWTMGAVGF